MGLAGLSVLDWPLFAHLVSVPERPLGPAGLYGPVKPFMALWSQWAYLDPILGRPSTLVSVGIFVPN